MKWYKTITICATLACAIAFTAPDADAQTQARPFAQGVGSATAQSGVNGRGAPVFVAPSVGAATPRASEYNAAPAARKTTELSGDTSIVDEIARAEAALADSQARAQRRSHTVRPIDAPMTLGSLKSKPTGGLQQPRPQTIATTRRPAPNQQYLQYGPSRQAPYASYGTTINAIDVPTAAPQYAPTTPVFSNAAPANAPAIPELVQDDDVGFSTSGKATQLPTPTQLDPSLFTDPELLQRQVESPVAQQPETAEDAIPDFNEPQIVAEPQSDVAPLVVEPTDVLPNADTPDHQAELTFPEQLSLESDPEIEDVQAPILAPQPDLNQSQAIFEEPQLFQESQDEVEPMPLTNLDESTNQAAPPANEIAPPVEAVVLPSEESDFVELTDDLNFEETAFEDAGSEQNAQVVEQSEETAPSPVKPNSPDVKQVDVPASQALNPEPQVLQPESVTDAPKAPVFSEIRPIPGNPQGELKEITKSNASAAPSAFPDAYDFHAPGASGQPFASCYPNAPNAPYAPYGVAKRGGIPTVYGMPYARPSGQNPYPPIDRFGCGEPSCDFGPAPFGCDDLCCDASSKAPGLIFGVDWLWWTTGVETRVPTPFDGMYVDDGLSAVGTALRGRLGVRGANGFDAIYSYTWFDQGDSAQLPLVPTPDSLDASLRTSLEIHDLEVGRWNSHENLAFRPYVGFRWTSLTSEYKLQGQSVKSKAMVRSPFAGEIAYLDDAILDEELLDFGMVSNATAEPAATVGTNARYDRSRLNAYGLRLGAEFELGLAGGLGLYGKGGGVLAVGDVKSYGSLTRADGVVVASNLKNTYFTPSLEASLGVKYDLGRLQARAGYEFNYWYNAENLHGVKTDFLAHGAVAGRAWNY